MTSILSQNLNGQCTPISQLHPNQQRHWRRRVSIEWRRRPKPLKVSSRRRPRTVRKATFRQKTFSCISDDLQTISSSYSSEDDVEPDDGARKTALRSKVSEIKDPQPTDGAVTIAKSTEYRPAGKTITLDWYLEPINVTDPRNPCERKKS